MKTFTLILFVCLNFIFASAQWGTSGPHIIQQAPFNGNVGIGTSAPAYKLSVVGSAFISEGTAVKQNPLNLGNWSGNPAVPQYRFYTDDQGTTPLQIHSTRWSGGLSLTRDDPNGLFDMMRVTSWNGVGTSLGLYNQSNQLGLLLATNGSSYFNGGFVGIGTVNPSYPLDVNGLVHTSGGFVADAPVQGAFAAWFRGFASGNGNVIMQGGAGNYPAYWMTASQDYFMIGGNGGTEPTMGAINVSYLGNVGIGTTYPGTTYKLAVEGKIAAREIKVTVSPFADYVFNKQYMLRDLRSLEKYINTYRHLPGIPSAEEFQKNNGVELGEFNGKLLEKVEELTLYIIELNKKIEKLEKANSKSNKKLSK